MSGHALPTRDVGETPSERLPSSPPAGVPVGLGVLEADGTLSWANQELADILACPDAASLVGLPLETFHAIPELVVELVRDRLVDGRARGVELELRRRDGEPIHVRVNVDVGPGERSAAVFSMDDVTAQRSADDENTRGEKMEAVVRFAAGVAHDYNNLLTTIIGEARQLARTGGGEHELHEGVQAILDAAQRAAGITRRLLVFSQSGVSRTRVVHLDDAVGRLIPSLERILPDDVALTLRVEGEGLGVRMDPAHLTPILENLVRNASEAMPTGGRIVVEVGKMDAPADTEGLELHPAAHPGRYVALAVGDTGIGMNQETRRRIFDPFFTTKAEGKGYGLGLATVFGLVRKAAGHVAVMSAPGYGTVLRILLPLTEAEASPAPPRVRRIPGTGVAQRTARVLVVDDEAPVREVMRKVLERAGFEVHGASDGLEARRFLMGTEVDLLLSDVMMPRVKGTELAAWARRYRPNLPVLLVSGYSDSPLLQEWVDEDADVFLPKPFEPDELLERVRKRLRR